MPTVTVSRDLLFQKIGLTMSDDEMDKLCFEFGIELDEVVDTDPSKIEYKFDIPANRYDLLCIEGIANSLSVFLQKKEVPRYIKVIPPKPIVMNVLPPVKEVRPFVVTAVIRDIQMTQSVYDSLIDLQEKLHHNICRKRTLVAIGVHDLDTLTPPFIYSADPPKDIKFQPLNQTKSFRADELMEFYQKDTHLKPYLHIIKDEPLYPIIRDSKNVVLSLPPIINGDHSKVTLKTKNIFIECTATDLNKAGIVLDTMVAMLSEYAANKYQTEASNVIYKSNGEVKVYPNLEYKMEKFDVTLANKTVGINLEPEAMAKSLSRMGLTSKAEAGEKTISVEIPPTRHDIIHQCDIMEDVAIAFGYSNIVAELPPTPTVASQYPLNKLTDQLRETVAQAGFTEVLTFSLCSLEDECEKLLQPRETKKPTLALIANPKTQDFQVARASLLPGLLKTVQANRQIALPLRLFEISDVVILDEKSDTGAGNRRHFCAIYYGKTPGFEVIHGLLDRFMQVLEIPFPSGYKLVPTENPTFFSGRCANVVCNGKTIGSLGVLNPKVLENFECPLLCSVLEIEIEDFL